MVKPPLDKLIFEVQHMDSMNCQDTAHCQLLKLLTIISPINSIDEGIDNDARDVWI